MSSDASQQEVLVASKLKAIYILSKLMYANTTHQLNSVRLIREFQRLTAQTKLMEVCLSLLNH